MNTNPHPPQWAALFLSLFRFLLMLFLTVGASVSAAEERPNVVFILSDDQSWGDYGFMGHPHLKTPNLDQLAGEGFLYERGYTTAAICRPSLASIVTGLYPHQTGVRGNRPFMGEGVDHRHPFADLDDTFELDDTKKKATAEQIDDAARYMIESGQDESGMAQKTREVYSRYRFMLDRKIEFDDRKVSKQINSDWSRYVENELISLYPGNEQWIRILQVLTRNINAQSGTLDLLRVEEGAA